MIETFSTSSISSPVPSLGIGNGCGVVLPLAELCRVNRKELDAFAVERMPSECGPGCDVNVEWSRRGLRSLVRHILESHHAYLRRELPRLGMLLELADARCGRAIPALRELASTFSVLERDLRTHLRKEETVIFPWVCEMEETRTVERMHCLTVRGPIRVVEQEHRVADEAISRLRRLTNDFSPPPDACGTVRALYAGLENLDRDLQRHFREEDEILFPRAIELERRLARQPG